MDMGMYTHMYVGMRRVDEDPHVPAVVVPVCVCEYVHAYA